MASVSDILNELYAADPSLRNEPGLQQIVERLLAVRPEIQVDETFRLHLRQELANRSEGQTVSKGNIFMRMKWLFAIPVVAVVALLVVPQLKLGKHTTSVATNKIPVKISNTTAQAFGSLSADFVSSIAPATRTAGTLDAAEQAKVMSLEKPQPLVPYTMYRYVYSGDDLQLSDQTLDVLERRLGNDASATSDLLASMGFGTVDLSSFGSLDVQNITLGKDNAYVININGQDGSVGIYHNPGNPTLLNSRDTNASSATSPLSDDDAIGIAKKFLGDHGIDLSLYGEPKVIGQSTVVAPAEGTVTAPDAKLFYGGDQQVIFPLIIDSSSVLGLWGDPVGLNVNVSPSDKSVSSVYGLTTHQYSSSEYPAVTDSATVLKVAERGGVYGVTPDANATVVDVKLGTPTRVLASMYRYDSGTSHDLLVPALRFPVIDPQSGMPTAIVVPLVKDLLQGDQAVIQPALPIDAVNTNSSGQSTSGSAGTAVDPAPLLPTKE